MKKMKNIQIPDEQHARLKKHCDDRHLKICRVVGEQIDTYLNGFEPPEFRMTKSGPLAGPETRFPEG